MNKSAVIILNYEDNNSVKNTLEAFRESDLSLFLVGLDDIKSPMDNLTFISNPQEYTPFGINLGIQKCKLHKNIIICGARSIPTPKYISRSVAILDKNSNIGCVGGRIIHKSNTENGKAIATAMGAPLGMGIFSFRSLQKSGFTDTVSVPVFRRDVIEKVGLFDETLIRNQDDDYSYRLKKAGYKIWHEASITSTYFVREKFSQLAGQFFQYGFWKNYVNKKHKTITTLRQLAPPIFVFTQIILLFTNLTILSILLLVYMVLLCMQSINLNHFKLIPSIKTLYAFMVMHYSYGIGYLSGFVYVFLLHKPAPELVKKITR